MLVIFVTMIFLVRMLYDMERGLESRWTGTEGSRFSRHGRAYVELSSFVHTPVYIYAYIYLCLYIFTDSNVFVRIIIGKSTK